MAFFFLCSDNIFLLISSRHWRVKDNCSNDAQPVVMEMNMQKHKFGFQRGRCTAGSCTCEGFVVMKGTHDFKTCYHGPRHHQYYNKEDYKKIMNNNNSNGLNIIIIINQPQLKSNRLLLLEKNSDYGEY